MFHYSVVPSGFSATALMLYQGWIHRNVW